MTLFDTLTDPTQLREPFRAIDLVHPRVVEVLAVDTRHALVAVLDPRDNYTTRTGQQAIVPLSDLRPSSRR